MKGFFIRLHRSLSTPQVEEQLILNDLPKKNGKERIRDSHEYYSSWFNWKHSIVENAIHKLGRILVN
jgi:hypothetical protein